MDKEIWETEKRLFGKEATKPKILKKGSKTKKIGHNSGIPVFRVKESELEDYLEKAHKFQSVINKSRKYIEGFALHCSENFLKEKIDLEEYPEFYHNAYEKLDADMELGMGKIKIIKEKFSKSIQDYLERV